MFRLLITALEISITSLSWPSSSLQSRGFVDSGHESGGGDIVLRPFLHPGRPVFMARYIWNHTIKHCSLVLHR